MAVEHRMHLSARSSADAPSTDRDDAALWDLLPGDADSLDALRGACLTSFADEGAARASIVAALEPLSSAQQEQIVQRLLREQARAVRDQTSSEPLFKAPFWLIASACVLCCWLGLHALAPAGAPPSQAAARDHALRTATRERGAALEAPRDVARDEAEALAQLAESPMSLSFATAKHLVANPGSRGLSVFETDPPFGVF